MLVRQEIQPIWFCCRVSRLVIFMTSHAMHNTVANTSASHGWLGVENHCKFKTNEGKWDAWREAMNVSSVAMSEQSRDEWIFVFLIKMYSNVLILILCCQRINSMFISSWCKIESKKIYTQKRTALFADSLHWKLMYSENMENLNSKWFCDCRLFRSATYTCVYDVCVHIVEMIASLMRHNISLTCVEKCLRLFNNSLSWVSKDIEDWFKIEFMCDMHQMWWQTEPGKNEWWMKTKNGKC